MADLTAPPIRTALINNPDGSPFQQANGSQGQLSTEKSWYYYWNNAGRQINANTLTLSQLVTHGTHADRPDPSTVVDGALYVEHDRGVLYQNWNGSWRYIAGTMYGSLSPDQRPTDLGLADGGFEFRSVDANTAYAPLHFVWSQTEWINATQVLYGTHAARPAADEKTPARTLYVETDRGSVIYQNQANVWTYCGGSMSNVLSARPADLGSADVGFVFIATDTGHTFRWNGAAWVDTTGFLDPTTTLGDLLVRGAAVVQRLGKGTNGQVLTANAGAPLGVDWEVPPGGSGSTSGVISAFGRIGNVVGATGDYTVAQITNAVANTRQVLAGTGLTGGGALSADVTLAAKAMAASGASHSAGIVPDPGSTAGTTHYLREDATWVVPPSGVGGAASLTHPNVVTKVDATAGQIVEGGITDLSAANSNSVYIDSTGKVGIGTTSPVALLTVAIASSTISSIVRLRNLNSTVGTGTGFLVSMTNSAASEVNYGGMAVKVSNSTAGSEVGMLSLRTAIPSGLNDTVNIVGQNVGIGTAAPGTPLDCAGMIRTTAGVSPTSGSGMELSFQGGNSYIVSYNRTAGSALPFNVIASTVQINANVGIGITPTTYQFQLSTDSAAKPSTNTWTIASDMRTKRNVARFEGDMEVIRRLDPIVAEYNGKAGTPDGARVVSFDAERLREIVPAAVSSVRGKLNPEDGEETDLLGVNTHEVFFHMLRAIQHLDREVEELKRKLAA